jgi:hypothetical protein
MPRKMLGNKEKGKNLTETLRNFRSKLGYTSKIDD